MKKFLPFVLISALALGLAFPAFADVSRSPNPTSITPGTGATNLGKAEDSAHASADTGVAVWAVQKATPADVSTEGDYAPIQVSAGRLWTSATIDAALPAGTNAIGKLAANSGVDIGDVDVTSFPDNEPINVAQINGVAVSMGSGVVGTGVQRVVLATDVALPAGTNAIGKLAPNSGVDVGDVDVTSVIPGTGATNLGKAVDTATGATDTGVLILGTRDDALSALTPIEGDNVQPRLDNIGRVWTRDGNPCMDHDRITSAAINTASSGNVEVVALSGSTLVYVCGFSLIADAAVDVQFIYGTGTACATGETDLTGIWGLGANGGIAVPNAGAVQFKAPAGNALCIENSGAVQVSGHVTYVQTATP